MKKSVKILFIIGVVTVIIVIVAFFIVKSISKSGLPDYNAVVETKGLKEEVKVYRDEFGIPHVYAKNEEDLYKVTGYISAQDRMWQMDLLRRITQGRLSEIFGEDMIESDVILRSLRIPEKSDMIIKQANPEVILALKAFSEGVNQYIEDYAKDMSFEFTILGYKPEQWKPKHCINLIGYMAWNLETGWSMESVLYKLQNVLNEEKFKEIVPDLGLQNTTVYPEFKAELEDSALVSVFQKINSIAPEIFKASNNWVVSGKKSVTGKPIFANDMHLGLMIPGVWSQIHQHIDGKLDVTGVILPGQPFVIAGHNENIAWGMTNVSMDGADFYIETINPENENQYKFNGEWKDIEVRKEIIKIKGEDETVEKEIKFTHRGPIISGFKNIKDKSISMHWVGNEFSDELRSIYLLNRAKNWDEFRNAVKTFKAVSQNIAYADIEGNIGLQCCAGIPIRKTAGHMFFPGDTSKYEWEGFVPFDSLPYTYNPECGYVFSANNKSTGDNFPYYISAWSDLQNRAKRIEQMLTEKELLSVEDFKAMQNDQKAVLVDEMLPILIKHIEEMQDLNDQEKEALQILKDWDHIYSEDYIAPTIFESFYIVLGKNIMIDEMPKELYEEFEKKDLFINYLFDKIIKTGESVLCDDINTDKKETFADMIKISFKETLNNFKEEHGKKITDTKWGELHKVALIQPIGKNGLMNFLFNLNRTYSVGGSYHTVSPYSYDYPISFIANHGASHRHIYNTANFDESYSIIPTGISGIPASDHYCDQTEMYINSIYHSDYTSFEKVKEKSVYEATFIPEK